MDVLKLIRFISKIGFKSRLRTELFQFTLNEILEHFPVQMLNEGLIHALLLCQGFDIFHNLLHTLR